MGHGCFMIIKVSTENKHLHLRPLLFSAQIIKPVCVFINLAFSLKNSKPILKYLTYNLAKQKNQIKLCIQRNHKTSNS